MKKDEFSAKLKKGGDKDAWVLMQIPFDVKERFGKRGRVSVKGTINGFAYRSSIFPKGDGSHFMMVNKKMQGGADVGAGDTVLGRAAVWLSVSLVATELEPRVTVGVGVRFKATLALAPRASHRQVVGRLVDLDHLATAPGAHI